MSSSTDGGSRDGQEQLSILLTNDDGIDDYERRLLPLARAFAAYARVTVVVSSLDCSGSSHYTSVGIRKQALESILVHTEHDQPGRIEVYAVEGFPADCVLLALRGILLDDPPDVVISGLNGGPNLGASWLYSGTVGAARVAAFSGIPAVAVSGVDFSRDEDIETIARWLGRLAQSSLVRNLGPKQFLTVGIPRGRLDEIQGIRIAPRSPALGARIFERVGQVRRQKDIPRRNVWLLQLPEEPADPPPESDVDLYRQGFIVVTPMLADEHDHGLLSTWSDHPPALPDWND